MNKYLILNIFFTVFIFSFQQTMANDGDSHIKAVCGFDNEGVFHLGDAKVEDGKWQSQNELRLEFFILTDYWRIQRQSENVAWDSKKAELKNISSNKGIISGIVGKAQYKCLWSHSSDMIRMSYSADVSASKKKYRAVNYAGIILSFDLDENVKIKMGERLINFNDIKGKTGVYGKLPAKIQVIFTQGITYELTNLNGFETYNIRKNKKEGLIMFRVPKVDSINNGCSLDITCNNAIKRISSSSFELAHDQLGWTKIKPVFDMKFIDVSNIVLDPPAGKHGFLRVKNGKFYFEKSKTPINFFGVQLVHGSKFPSKEEAKILASRIAAMGANIVRLHHIDYYLKGFGLWDCKEFDEHTRKFDKLLIDRMDYLIWELKKRGIYIHLDGITFRKFKSGDNVPAGTKLSKGMKGSAYTLDQPDIQRKQQEFFKLLWNHYNPYTKLKYKDDPAIALTEIINENDLFTHASLKHHFPKPFNDIMKNMFRKWQKNYGVNVTSWEKADERKMVKFRIEVMRKYYQNMYVFLRKIGVKIPITGTNWLNRSIKLGAANSQMDYTADHPYSRTEIFSENPYSAKGFAGYLAMGKVLNKPMMHNEWNIANSRGINRVASILYHIALSSAMGHDGSILFALFHHKFNYQSNHINSLNIGYDPGVCAVFPAAAIMFLRKDLKEAKRQFVIKPTWKDLILDTSYKSIAKHWKNLPRAAFFSSVAFDYSSVGTYNTSKLAKSKNILLSNANSKLPDTTAYPAQNSSKQLISYWKDGYFLLKSEKSKWAVGYLPGKEKIDLGDGVSIMLPEKQYACILLSSLDSNRISKFNNLMITTVSYIEQPGLKFSRKWAKAINLDKNKCQIARPVKVEITIEGRKQFAILQSIKLDGKISHSQKIAPKGTKLIVSLNGKSLVYKLGKTVR